MLLDAAKAGSLKLDRNSVVAIDEYGLLGTRQGLELLRLRDRYGFSIVALGDDKQCRSIEAGAIIELGRKALGAEQIPTILTTTRQKTDREKEITRYIREGRTKEALDMKREDGTVELVYGGYGGTVERAAKLWVSVFQETGTAPTVSVPTNRGAHNVSVAIRDERRALGLVGPDRKRLQVVDGDGRTMSLPLAVGDRVRLFANTGAKFANGRGGSIGRNGSVLDILAIGADDLTLRNLKTGTVGRVTWNKLKDKETGQIKLAYGDAMTIHTAQGLTADIGIKVLPSGSREVDGFTGYSALSRHKHRVHLLVNDAAEGAEVRSRRPLNDNREITPDDKFGNIGRNLAHKPEKDLALAMLERVRAIRRGSIRQFPMGLQAADARMAKGLPPSYLHEHIAQRRRDQALSAVMARIREMSQELHQAVRDTLARGFARGRDDHGHDR